jgi:hypothetical protein
MGHLFQGVTLNSTIIFLILTVYVSHYTVIPKYLQKATFRLASLEFFFLTCILFHFSTDHERFDIILHIPPSHERQTDLLRNMMVLSPQATRSSSFDA